MYLHFSTINQHRCFMSWALLSISLAFSCLLYSASIAPAQEDVSQPGSLSPLKDMEGFLGAKPDVIARLRCRPSKVAGQSPTDPTSWPICGFLGLHTMAADSSATNQIYYFGPQRTDDPSFDTYTGDFIAGLAAWRSHEPNFRSATLKTTPITYSVLDSVLRPAAESDQSAGFDLHPFFDSVAYVDSTLMYLTWEMNLFPGRDSNLKVPSWYNVVNYAPADNFDDYNKLVNGPASHRQCGDGKRLAILIHEPHSDPQQERLLFQFLNYLQTTYPDLFKQLTVIQEGQFRRGASRSAQGPHVQQTDPIDSLIAQSYTSWQTKTYAPMNAIDYEQGRSAIVRNFSQFLIGKKVPVDVGQAEKTLDNALRFYLSTTAEGELDPVRALMNLDTPKPFRERLSATKPLDANLATFLLNDDKINMRGAFAYKIYREGNLQPGGQARVKIFGLEDPGLYIASCALVYECVSSLGGQGVPNHSLGDEWRQIQPYRDWVMANNALEVLEGVAGPSIPIILASLKTHLPIMRELLCRAGVTGIMLAPTPSGVEAAASLFPSQPTTPFSAMFFNLQEAFGNINVPSGGSLKWPDADDFRRATESFSRPN